MRTASERYICYKGNMRTWFSNNSTKKKKKKKGYEEKEKHSSELNKHN